MASLEVATKLVSLCTGQEESRTWDIRLTIACGSHSEAVTSTSTTVVFLISLTKPSLGLGASASLMLGKLLSHALLCIFRPSNSNTKQALASTNGLRKNARNRAEEASQPIEPFSSGDHQGKEKEHNEKERLLGCFEKIMCGVSRVLKGTVMQVQASIRTRICLWRQWQFVQE